MSRGTARIYTIGHSTRTLEDLIAALKAHGVQRLIDIRTAPRSRYVPQFNAETLAEALPPAGIEYRHMKELGGWRKATAKSPTPGWRSGGFRGYADYMLTEDFAAATDRLMAMAREKTTAYMCAEATPYRCHRMLVSDALAAGGFEVVHIRNASHSEPHRITPFAVVEGTRITFPARRDTISPRGGAPEGRMRRRETT